MKKISEQHCRNKKNFLKWSLTNHPDKQKQSNKDKVTKDFQVESTCVDELLSNSENFTARYLEEEIGP